VVDLDVDARILKWMFEKQGGKVWTAFVWLSIGTSGGALVNTVMNFRVT